MNKKENPILCIGACNIDYKFKAKASMIKHTSNPIDSKMSYGGVVRNVGENISRLGHNVSLMTMVGDDLLGEKLISELKTYMDVSLIEKRDFQSTGQYYAVINIDGNMDIAYANMAINDDMNHDWINRYRKKIEAYKLVVSDLNTQKSGISALIDISREKDLKLFIIGVSGPKMDHLPEDIKGVDLIIVNKDESQAYFKTNENSSEVLCRKWLEKGVKQIIITAGKDDLFFADKRGVKSLPVISIPQKDIKDVTGAGDAFSGGVISALMEGKSLEEAIYYGMVNSSLTIQSEDSVRKNINYKQFIQEVRKYEKIFKH